jgi:hypothetical protein
MADNRVEYGFRPVRTVSGAAMPQPIECIVASAYQGSEAAASIDLKIGDPVRRLSTGYIEHSGAGDDIYGVVVGIVQYYDSAVGAPVISDRVPGATAWTGLNNATKVLVIPAADIVFEADCDEATTATTEAAYLAFVGENVDTIYVPSGGKGNPRLDISTHVATTAQWRIVEISKTRNNQDFSGNYVKLCVVVNETQQAPYVTAGI